MEDAFTRPRTRSLLEHSSSITDLRQSCKVMYRLPEVLLLVVRGSTAGCDDYEDKVERGRRILAFFGILRSIAGGSLRRLAADGDEPD